ncbi:rhamnogalacturonyl hydrolase YesR [Mucilaginibacter yixingensis]|uniref:Rhamnogalacturonyl hydrolase YesR n=1 Tax=Mucilaginibacter yixingensis TaxID=1295612 RepID=A0A2T5J7T8_9SPHI|nr:glycoside hydrolase family 88 protein [Mucilaginibacter yixingensis]PTQ95527.1 rhamnogalacturonyl hydrolase YesR [Mucilaginibacter yixingensis]
MLFPKLLKNSLPVLALAVMSVKPASAQNKQPYSQQMAHTVTTLWKDSLPTGNKWTYDQGVILKGFEGIWQDTGDRKYYDFIKYCLDKFVQPDGSIRTYRMDEHNLDYVLCGRNVLTLYKQTKEEKYLKALQMLRSQLATQPRTFDGGFWHKKRYTNQMWLDGLYMAEPFYAEYAATFHEDSVFNDVARQFILMEQHSRDDKTGLLYHAWDAAKAERWADPKTGRSPHVWGRAMGWYGMALVDALTQFPADHPKRKELIAILQRYADAVTRFQDKPTGLWYDIVDMGTEKGNYLEASASCMFVYALAKGVREGFLPASYLPVAQKGYDGIIKKFIRTDERGLLVLDGTVQVSGLGGKPYRDGSYAYYMSEKVITNDAKGVGAFLQASVEMERAAKNKK